MFHVPLALTGNLWMSGGMFCLWSAIPNLYFQNIALSFKLCNHFLYWLETFYQLPDMNKICSIHTILIDDELQNCSLKSCYKSAYMYFCIYFVIREGSVYGDWQIIHDQVSFYQVRHAELNIEYASSWIERKWKFLIILI